MLDDFLIPFLTLSAAELLDKSQLSLLLLATKINKPFHLLLGAMLGFIIVDGTAILLGAWITTVIPNNILTIISGIIFIIFGILALRESSGEEKKSSTQHSPILTGFLTILLVEWGDKTQLASALFATQFNPFYVFAGILTALFLLSAAAIFLGKYLNTKINKKLINRIAGCAFVLIGLLFLFAR